MSDATTTEQVKDQAREQAQQAKVQAQKLGGQAQDKVREQVDQRSTQAGERVHATAQDARSVAEELRRQGKDQPAQLAEQAADRAEQLGGYLRDADADRILRDVEDFGRRKPWAVALGGLALGIAAGRLMKASSSRRYEQLGREPYAYTPQPPRSLPPATPNGEPAVPAPPPGRPPIY